jgi:hypothetical protein
MLDVTKYEDIQLDLPNIIVKWKIGEDRTGHTFEISRHVQDLIIEAATKHPNWLFLCGGDHRRGMSLGLAKDSYVCGRFYVYEGRENLGWISWEYRGRSNEVVYAIGGNDRIANQRERGSVVKTKELKKAMKVIDKSFSRKTIDEHVRENHKTVSSRLYYVQMEKWREFSSSYHDVSGYLMDHILGNWDTYKAIALTHPKAKAEPIENILNRYEEQRIAKDIHKCFTNGNGAVVTIHGNDYAVSSHSSGNADEPEKVEIYGTDTLPSWIRGKIGMLKLIEKGQLLNGAGYRLDDNVFFVARGEND